MSKVEPTVVIMVRAPEWLHKAVKEAADANEMSINMYCKRVLTKAVKPEEKRNAPQQNAAFSATSRGA